MAEEHKFVSVVNNGKRHYDVLGVDGKPARHSPGAVLEYTEESFAKLGYEDLVDITKLPGQVNLAALKADNAALKAENEKLKADLAALLNAEPEVKIDGRRKKGQD